MTPKIVCVAGPTACGKTTLGVLLAQRFHGEVVSADSMQIYRGMTVGTAAPTEAEMQGVPHHMIAVAEPSEQWSAAEYVAKATPIVDDILSRGKLPILVGGTGLWMDALIRGHGFAGGHAGGEVRRELETRFDRDGIEPLLAELRQVDPESAARLHPADTKRILRALEVYLETGETISAHNAATRQLPPRYDAVWIGLQFADRADMKALIDRRVDKMAEEGLLEEVQALLAMGLPRNATAMQAIGYKEFLGVLDGTLTEQEALELVKLRSRQYAKRQLTWLRRNPAIHWIYWEKGRDFARALQISTEILTASGLGYAQGRQSSTNRDSVPLAQPLPNKEGAEYYAEKNQFTGSLPPASSAGAAARHRVFDERIPDAGHRYRLRSLCGGAGKRRQAAGDLQTRHFHSGPPSSGGPAGK